MPIFPGTGLILGLFGVVDQRNMGMSMKVERSTVEQIKQRFETNKKKKEEEKKKYGRSLIKSLSAWRGFNGQC